MDTIREDSNGNLVLVPPLSTGTVVIGKAQLGGTLFVTQASPNDGTAAVTVAGAGTIALGAPVLRLTTGGAVTGVILTAGSISGQQVVLINTSANSITFAAAGTSNVADGTSAVIAANTRMTLVWDATAARWYHGN